jgi:hypothetical protein
MDVVESDHFIIFPDDLRGSFTSRDFLKDRHGDKNQSARARL